MTDDVDAAPRPLPFARDLLLRLRLVVVVGVPVGVLVVGIGSRLAMMLLRVTSSDSVIGLQSDDDFTIGQFTFGGTYNLMHLGALVGMIGAGFYQWVSPWLIGPTWFRRVTVAAAAGAVVGSMLVHSDGVDFTVLTPHWLAIAVFVALPAVFAVVISIVVDRMKQPGRPTPTGVVAWLVPVLLVAAFPGTLIGVTVGTAILLVWLPLRRAVPGEQVPVSTAAAWTIRSIFLLMAAAGLVALVNDVTEIV